MLTRWQRLNKLIVGSLATSVVALQGVLVVAPGSAAHVIAVAAAGALLGLHSPLLIATAQEVTPGAESAIAGVLLGATTGAAGVILSPFNRRKPSCKQRSGLGTPWRHCLAIVGGLGAKDLLAREGGSGRRSLVVLSVPREPGLAEPQGV